LNDLATTVTSIDDLLAVMVEHNASDLHITAGSPPVIRVNGKLERLVDFEKMSGDETRDLVYRIVSTEQQKQLETKRQLDFSYSVPGLARFRVNSYFQRASIGAAFRLIPAEIKSLEDLNMPTRLYELAEKPRGLILVTGPTGSGKSTTLASLLDYVNHSRHEHILTIEDPIEFLHWHGTCIVNQREIGPDAVTFAEALRAALRQDPDVILVGEIRDVDTARIAVQSALPGHFVLSSVHATDTVAALHRLIDMGIETFLVAASVTTVLSQRLVRRVCPYCREERAPTPQDVAFLRSVTLSENPGEGTFVHGTGCNFCARTGYLDRVGVYEMLPISPRIRELVLASASHADIRRAARSEGMRTLPEEAARLVRAGITTTAEVLRSVYVTGA